MLGVLLVNKPKGITSHDAVSRVRRQLNTRRVGHSGTLDPLAQGLLVMAVGPATRFLQYLPLEPKVYEARVTFGVATESYDAAGDVTSEAPVPADLDALIEEAKKPLTGEIEQVPPMYSAIKKDGKKLYEYARKGETVERRARTVFISEFTEIDAPAENVRCYRIECSGGTYIRSLAHDLGEALGCGAHLSGLVRTGVGKFKLDDAVELDEVTPEDLVPLSEALPPMPLVRMDEAQTKLIRDGRAIDSPGPLSGRCAALVDPTGEVISAARVEGDRLQPECVIPESAFVRPV
jgi:tRNA pseudouridine55 synthase